MNYTDQQLAELYANLPQKLQDYILSPEVEEALDQTIEAWGIERGRDFRQTVFYLLIGALDADEFMREVRDKYALSEEESAQLLVDIDTLILQDSYNAAELPPEEEQGTVVQANNNFQDRPQSSIALNRIVRPAEHQQDSGTPLPVIPPKAPAPSLMDTKLGAPTNLPREQINFFAPETTDAAKTDPAAKKPYIAQDPYRESAS
jgi:hypothetical protein